MKSEYIRFIPIINEYIAMGFRSTNSEYDVITMARTKPKRLHTINIRLDDDTYEGLHEIAEAETRSFSNLAFAILRDWLAERRKRDARLNEADEQS
jgi:predicted CopG family antitoxin